MKNAQSAGRIEQVPLEKISVINPRSRNRKVFEGIVRNIDKLGLKRPITVIRNPDGGDGFELVCGQGRLEAFKALGQARIPAIVVEATEEEGLVMSLVENIARRQHRAIDLLQDIEGMKRRGYAEDEIARRTDLTPEYVRGVIHLLENGEHRLLRAVESEAIPLSVAIQIATSEDSDVQEALHKAYENGELKGKRLAAAQHLVEQRRRRGKALGSGVRKGNSKLSPSALIRTYKQDVDRKRLLVRKAEATRERLMFVVHALKTLLADDELKALLQAEGLDTLPRNLATRIQGA
ncbi:chromosome partitioning protein, ParB family [Enhydrobacter aerosaccus]|uniref:Chromosome partitioning protein, ParB family n=1 Tax=Enhydrobacter aerosaccus TaxID=225324 RepID=A0A1T4TLJ1_9HYPH|nr:plasmid partitioning protein RepB C-terminal domain-containing protein [Enhydrobacter aerosaccus]SKA41345.1 chromosome partitioning protein, ParB family [Enhydrobacter aerosaccus]